MVLTDIHQFPNCLNITMLQSILWFVFADALAASGKEGCSHWSRSLYIISNSCDSMQLPVWLELGNFDKLQHVSENKGFV